jgi:SAM-dependent methyltransferase
VGCGNGFATKQLAPLVKSIVGVDQSDGMIRRAKEEGALPSNATFAVADVLDLSPARVGTFDVALTIRCLINLPDWQMQQGALANIAGILKPGGLYIFVEGLREGRASQRSSRCRPRWNRKSFPSSCATTRRNRVWSLLSGHRIT